MDKEETIKIDLLKSGVETSPIDYEKLKIDKSLYETNDIKKQLLTAPTYSPVSWKEQESYYGQDLYKYIGGSWVKFQSANYACGRDTIHASTSGAVAITTGFKPAIIKITAFTASNNGGYSIGSATATNNYGCIYTTFDGTNWSPSLTSDYMLYCVKSGGAEYLRATLSAIGDTTFTLTYSNSGSASGAYILWEAFT